MEREEALRTRVSALESELATHRRRQRALFDAVNDGVLLVDRGGTVVDVNAAFEALSGRARADLIGSRLETVLDLRDENGDSIGALVPGRRLPYQPSDPVRLGGRDRPVLLSVQRAGDDGYAVSLHDVSGRRRRERELLESRQMLQNVLDTIPVRVFWKDRQSTYLGCNRHFATDAGRSDPAELVGDNDFGMGWKDQAELYRADDASVMESGRAKLHYEEPQTTPDGELIWLRTSKIPLRNVDDEVVGVLGTYEDVTARKKAEQELEAHRAALQQALDGIAILDLDGRFQFVNRAWAEMHGRSIEEFEGATCALCHDERQLEEEVRPFLEWVGAEGGAEAVIGHRRRDATLFPAHVSAAVLRDALGRPTGTTVIARDVSRQRELEEHLYRAQRIDSIGRLAGGVAHDFNNMLVPILGYAEMYLADAPPDDRFREDMTHILEAAERARELTRQLLAFGRQQVFDLRVVRVRDVLTGFARMLDRSVRENVSIRYDLSETRPVRCDVSQLEQVALNLVLNAGDAMPEGGSITIATRDVDSGGSGVDAGPQVELTVTDTGCGMEPEIQPRIFEPFFTTKGERGNGLGLATVYGIVRQHRGQVRAESDPGRGSVLRVLLPAVDEVPASPPPSAETTGGGAQGTETVAVVEDEDSVRAFACKVLRAHGYRIAFDAGSVEEGVRCAAQFPGSVDLLVTDVVLREGNGLDLYEALCESKPGMKALFMSAYGGEAIAESGLPPGIANYLQKPFSTKRFLEKVREAIEA